MVAEGEELEANILSQDFARLRTDTPVRLHGQKLSLLEIMSGNDGDIPEPKDNYMAPPATPMSLRRVTLPSGTIGISLLKPAKAIKVTSIVVCQQEGGADAL